METRLRAAMSLYAFAVLGVFLVVAPWSAIWERAVIALLAPSIGPWARSGWVRGLVSGVGALDLLVAAQSARELWRGQRPPLGRPTN